MTTAQRCGEGSSADIGYVDQALELTPGGAAGERVAKLVGIELPARKQPAKKAPAQEGRRQKGSYQKGPGEKGGHQAQVTTNSIWTPFSTKLSSPPPQWF